MGQPGINSQEALENLAARAEEAQHKGDYRAAAQIYQEMLKAKPDSAEVRANLGLMYHLLGEYARSDQRYFYRSRRDARGAGGVTGRAR
jgi:Tfp pilus assembly protein PilF